MDNIPKYRAWHKQRQIMLPVLQIDLDPEHGGVFVESSDGHYCGCRLHMELWPWDAISLMQFTTISNDTNQEIWQGDICRCKEDTENGRMHEQYEVYWSEDRWGLRHIERKEDYDNGSYYQAYEINWREWEVIGNIWGQQP